ncbi:hypothetical protein F5B18DRAFT_93106 [Nemania serpens]|nr:hypothetical protein F5B18DRAFT_93106 [Nemania serpens]
MQSPTYLFLLLDFCATDVCSGIPLPGRYRDIYTRKGEYRVSTLYCSLHFDTTACSIQVSAVREVRDARDANNVRKGEVHDQGFGQSQRHCK